MNDTVILSIPPLEHPLAGQTMSGASMVVQAVADEGVSAILVTHQLRDAFYVATHEAVRKGNELEFVQASPAKAEMTEFLMLKDGLVAFEGAADELRHSDDPYLKAFLS